jgi:HEPN domain-containing protein
MPPDPDSPLTWLRYAESDLALAEARTDDRVLLENLCFHAQQVVEKSIKAVLVLFDIAFPKTHNLQRLLDLLPPDVTRTQELLEARALSGYATVLRYPGVGEPPSEEDYRSALRVASAALDWARQVVSRAS